MSKLAVALSADPCGGKSEVGRYLAREHEFVEFTGSAYLQEEASKIGITLRERADYADFQRKLRVERSKSFITDLVFAMPEERVQNIGLRNKFDTIAHLERGGIVIALHCPSDIRFQRAQEMDDPKYPDNYPDFIAAEASEYDDPDPYGQHTHWTMDRATYHIDSSQPLAVVQRELDLIVASHTV